MPSRTQSLEEAVCLGIDVGGTSTKLGLVDRRGQVVHEGRIPTPELQGPEAALTRFQSFANEALEVLRGDPVLAGVGLAVPGILDADAGILREVANLPQWQDVPLCQRLAETFEQPAVVVNDANAAAYAERWHRRLESTVSLALITLGTGIGGGFLNRHGPLHGDHGCAVELGHVPIDFGPEARVCGCGRRGHLEAYAGAPAVIEATVQLLPAHPQSSLATRIEKPENLTPRMIAEEAAGGDDLALRIVDRTATFVGRGVATLCQLLDPGVVLLGGAMTFGGSASPVGRRFLERVRQTVGDLTLEQVGAHATVDFAELGNRAGVIGAALIAAGRTPPAR